MICDLCGETMMHSEHTKKDGDYATNYSVQDSYVCPNCCYYVETLKVSYKIDYIRELEGEK